MTRTENYDKVNDPNYRIDEIDQARERIASRFRKKIELVTQINSARAELNMLEMQDATDRYLIRELNKSPYSSLKAYFKMEQRPQPNMTN
jgi:3'-phosphoadenosine 5'-phosphosulfate sulfotransferase